MQSLEEIYHNLTGVSLHEQRDIWDERGKGYYGEYLVFEALFEHLNDDSKILMNVEIPAGANSTTEIDLLLIHETGLYCFEMKHYKGDIFCNFDQENWVQAFRTSKNNAFYNPVRQNNYHRAALRKMFPQVPVYSYVVFTNQQVVLHDGNRGVFEKTVVDESTVCTLDWLSFNIGAEMNGREPFLSTKEINEAFSKLEGFSKNNEIVETSGDEMSFSDFVSAIKSSNIKRVQEQIDRSEEELQRAKKEYEKKAQEAERNVQNARKSRTIAILLSVLICIASCFAVLILPQERIAEVENKYQDFFSKFDDAKASYEGIDTSGLLAVSDVMIRNSDFSNAVTVSFTVTGTGKDYFLGLTADSRLILRKKDGTVKEADIY